jgi:hypothetical protein
VETDQSITNGAYSIFTGCPDGAVDYKWRVTDEEAGSYIITVDLENETVDFALQGGDNAVEQNDFSKISVYPNPAKESMTIDLGEQNSGSVSVFSIDGRNVYSAELTNGRTSINTGEMNATGLLFLRISSPLYTETIKVIVE